MVKRLRARPGVCLSIGAGWLFLLACWLVLGEDRAFADDCTQVDCVEVNYYWLGLDSDPCRGYCGDTMCAVIQMSCYVCTTPNPYWCRLQDVSKKCDGTGGA